MLAAITVLVFLPALSGEVLLWDDDINLFSTPHVREISSESLRWMFTDTAQVLRYKPLSWLAWASLHEFYELGEAPYHLLNVSLHVLNTILFFVLLRTLLCQRSQAEKRHSFYAAAAGAAFWAWHPMRIEPVAWISGLGYPLALFFALGSALTLVLWLRGDNVRNARNWLLLLSVGLWILSLISYPSALCFVPAFPLLVFLVGRDRWRKAWSIGPHLALSILLACYSLMMRVLNPGTWEPAALATIDFSEQLGRLGSLWFWALTRVLPFFPNRSVHDQIVHPLLHEPLVILAWTVVLLITAGLWFFRHRSSLPLLCWIAFIVALLPHVGFAEPVFLPAERYTYTAALFIALALAFGLSQLNSPRWIIVGGVASIAMAGWSHLHADLWHDNVVFFERNRQLADTPEYRNVLTGCLGIALHRIENRSDQAIPALEAGMRGHPDIPAFMCTLADAYRATGQLQRAADLYQQYLQSQPNNSDIANSLGITLMQLGDTANAITVFEQACMLRPTPLAHFNLARALIADGRPHEALEALSDELQQAWPPAAALAQQLRATTEKIP